MFTLGVEEEYQLIDPETGDLRHAGPAVLEMARAELGDEVQPELLRSQVEIATPVCRTLDEVSAALARARQAVGQAAIRNGCRLGAAGTHPFAVWQDQQVTPKARYRELTEEYQQLARETLIFGCHVHIGIDDPETAIDVMNRMRPWLAVLIAIGANSPFWAGVDTGYASYRTEVFRRWPQTGTPQRFTDRAEYDQLIECLVRTEAIAEATRIYWDARPSARFPTVEFRVSDVLMRTDEAVAVAGLIRGLVAACHADGVAGRPVPDPRPEILEAAAWRAARDGLAGRLIDPFAGHARPAPDMVARALEVAGPALAEADDWQRVSTVVNGILEGGTGAARQRAAFARRNELVDVVDLIVRETAAA